MTPKILQLQEIQSAGPVVEALSAEFLRPLRLENPPPIRIARRPAGATWGGFCEGQEFAEHQEVVLQDPSAPRESWLVTEGLQSTYVHEITHKFLCGYDAQKIGGDHGPVFFSLQLLLFLRLPHRPGNRPWCLKAGIYDLQDVWGGDHPYTPGQALDWAVSVAEALAQKDITAEAAAAKIARRYTIWREALTGAPAKRKAAHAARAEREAALIRKAANAKWWAYYSVILGLVVGFLGGFLAA